MITNANNNFMQIVEGSQHFSCLSEIYNYLLLSRHTAVDIQWALKALENSITMGYIMIQPEDIK